MASKEEKPHKATKRKLEEARKRGELATSPEANSFAAYAAAFAALIMLGEYLFEGLRKIVLGAVRTAELSSAQQHVAFTTSLQEILLLLPFVLLPVAIAGMFAAIAMGWLQTRGSFSMTPLVPKPERINPTEGFTRLFSVHKLAEVAKSLVTVVALVWVVWLLVQDLGSTALELGRLQAGDTLTVVFLSVKKLLIFCGVVFAVSACADYAQKYFLFHYQQRMSFEELKRDHRESNGDPHVRSRRRAMARELGTVSVQQKVAQARVVVTNPTHFAVALYYEENETALPIVVAKGVDEYAAIIRESAKNAGVPLYEDRMLARMLYANVNEDDYINEEAISAVAAVFAWLSQLRRSIDADE